MLLIDFDTDLNSFVCPTKTPEDRRVGIDALHRVRPGVTFSVDAGRLVLTESVVLEVRQSEVSSAFDWTATAARLADILLRNKSDAPLARARVALLQQPGEADRALYDYDMREVLDQHQRVAVAAMTDPVVHGICLFDEQGAGKTVMSIHAFDRLRKLDRMDSLLIFAPKNMLGEWQKDFQRFTGAAYKVSAVSGSKTEKYVDLIAPSDVYVTNYETAVTLESTLSSLVSRSKGRVALIVDESFFVKNRDAKRSAAIRRIRAMCEKCWMLCGTPAPNDASDVVHQFDIADAGVTFADVTVPQDPVAAQKVIGETITAKGVYLRRLKADVLPDLPAKSFHRVQTTLTADQSELYKLHLEKLAGDVARTTDDEFKSNLTSFMARRIHLLQICSCPDQVDPTCDGVSSKLLAMDELLRSLIEEQNEKVIVWSFFRSSIESIFRRYAKYNPVRIDGSVSDTSVRAEAVNRFQTDNETMLFVANPAAAGAGLTLTRSHIAIYESFSPQAAHYMQSLDRIHRRGQGREVDYYILLSEGTIEEAEYDRLLRKEQQAADLFGDSVSSPVRREVFLRELLEGLRKFTDTATISPSKTECMEPCSENDREQSSQTPH